MRLFRDYQAASVLRRLRLKAIPIPVRISIPVVAPTVAIGKTIRIDTAVAIAAIIGHNRGALQRLAALLQSQKARNKGSEISKMFLIYK